ncbi:hypothetical protein PoB_007508400 [Plakobranchus ocellatus]|uniref:Uncharacterized protein n=1 Tax=Plakobranchus ocellatus TaxID=259542 RepID=A0AAV4DWK4_9GAST|nr:hypothetical protein PoB_007508400 [Plakobranchus ocellatus]
MAKITDWKNWVEYDYIFLSTPLPLVQVKSYRELPSSQYHTNIDRKLCCTTLQRIKALDNCSSTLKTDARGLVSSELSPFPTFDLTACCPTSTHFQASRNFSLSWAALRGVQ